MGSSRRSSNSNREWLIQRASRAYRCDHHLSHTCGYSRASPTSIRIRCSDEVPDMAATIADPLLDAQLQTTEQAETSLRAHLDRAPLVVVFLRHYG